MNTIENIKKVTIKLCLLFIILGGTTFHRGLHFTFKPGEYLPLEPQSLNNLRQQFENMFVVIIGEIYTFKNQIGFH